MLFFATSAITFLTCLTLVSSSPFTLRVAHQERGILTLSFDPAKTADTSLELLSTTPAGYFPDNSSTSAGIFAFEKLPGGQLKLLDTEISHGDGGVFVDVTPDGKTLASANIDGSTVSVFPLISPGKIGEAAHTFQYNLTKPGPGTGDSQVMANPHAVVFNPSGDIMAVPDKGADRLYLYQVHSTNHIEQIRNMTFLPGTGPRHLLFSEYSHTKTLMYLIGELDNTMNVFAFDRSDCNRGSDLNETLQITHLQSISTLNSGTSRTEPKNEDLASEVHLSHDGRFLYVSNRNTESVDNIDSIAVYSVDPHSEQPLEFLGLNSTHGKIPRHFSLSPDHKNRFVAVANQVTNDLHIMERDVHTGFLGSIVGKFSFGKLDISTKVGPMAVVWG
ncbi:hypothetical protein FDECE_5845 [Fusarium decemcellulare]|nr:hypothetical protein FDECE_5845 [Fusarium decemcellulare]